MIDVKERAAIIAYITKRLPEITRNQIGKTTLQKLVYLLSRESKTGYRYTMYHYGPYSGGLSFDLNVASDILHLIDIKWVENQGYEIKFQPGKEQFIMKNLEEEKRKKIDEILKEYGEFNTIQLSLIATAFYVLDNTDVKTDDELIKVVSSIKPEYKDRVKRVLETAQVIPLPA